MTTSLRSIQDSFNEKLYEIPANRAVYPAYYSRDLYEINSELHPGGDLRLSYRNRSEEDCSGFSIRFTLIESDVVCPFDKEFVWTNLAQDFSLPPGRYRMEPVEN